MNTNRRLGLPEIVSVTVPAFEVVACCAVQVTNLASGVAIVLNVTSPLFVNVRGFVLALWTREVKVRRVVPLQLQAATYNLPATAVSVPVVVTGWELAENVSARIVV